MNCREWEERLALYAGNDLGAAERAALERHLSECAGCQVFLSGLKDSLERLKEAHEDPLAEPHFAAVRARVLSGLRHERQWRRWVWGLAGVAAVLVLAVAPLLRLGRRETPPAPVAVVTRPPAPPVEKPVVERRIRRVKHFRPRAVPPATKPSQPATPAEPFVVKLLTDDPDVVIYWISDPRGEPQ